MFKNFFFLSLFLFASCSTTTIFDRQGGIDFVKLHKASMAQVISYFKMEKSQYKTRKGKKGTTILTYIPQKKVSKRRGRRRGFGFSREWYQIDFQFSFNTQDQLVFAKLSHAYTGNRSGLYSDMKSEYEAMKKALTAQAGEPKTTRFGKNGINHKWTFKGTKKISVRTSPSDQKSTMKPYHNFMVQTEFWFN